MLRFFMNHKVVNLQFLKDHPGISFCPSEYWTGNLEYWAGSFYLIKVNSSEWSHKRERGSMTYTTLNPDSHLEDYQEFCVSIFEFTYYTSKIGKLL